MININLELYKTFYIVAKHMSFSKASRELYVSQSAISQSIKRLEDTLNTSLFIRSNKITLTNEGKDLYNNLINAFSYIDNFEDNIKDTISMKKGSVRIGASDTISKYYLLKYIKIFHDKYPNIDIILKNKPSPECNQLLLDGEIDFAVINYDKDATTLKTINITQLTSTENIFIAPLKYKELSNKRITLNKLCEYPLITLESNSTTRMLFDKLMKERGYHIKPHIEVQNIELLIKLTKIGLGISFVPDISLDENNMKGLCTFTIDDFYKKIDIGLVYREGSILSRPVKEMINIIKNN